MLDIKIKELEILQNGDVEMGRQLYIDVNFNCNLYTVLLQLPHSGDSQHEILQKSELLYKQNVDDSDDFFDLLIDICIQHFDDDDLENISTYINQI